MDKRWTTLPRTLDKVWIGVSGERVVEGYSKWIEKYQGTNYSHAIAIYWSRDLQDFVITNCHGVSVQLDTAQQFNKTSLLRRLWAIDVDTIQRQAFVQKMVELDGAPYSPNHQLAWLVIGRYFRLKWSPFGDGNDSFWCSEFADEMLRSASIPCSYQILDRGRNTIAPIDNVKALQILAEKHHRVNEVKF